MGVSAATLREAFRRTPLWLGFNIELKYPTDAELQSMATRWYSRNYFVDAILKVRPGVCCWAADGLTCHIGICLFCL